MTSETFGENMQGFAAKVIEERERLGKKQTIRCTRCHEQKEPVVKHGIYCAECWQWMEDEMERRAQLPVKTNIFSHKEGRLD